MYESCRNCRYDENGICNRPTDKCIYEIEEEVDSTEDDEIEVE